MNHKPESESTDWGPDTEAMIEARASGASHATIAEMLGVSAKTVARRLAQHGVAASVTQHRRDRVEAIVATLVTKSEHASEVLGELLDSDNERIRLTSASRLISMSVSQHRQHLIEDEVAKRIEALEAKLLIRLAADEQQDRYGETYRSDDDGGAQ